MIGAFPMRGQKKTTRRRTQITIETERVLIVNRRAGATQGWCEQCGAFVKLATPEIAAALTGMSRRAVYRLIENGQVHFSESPSQSPEAPISVCLESLTIKKP
jgi:hypothetical protein